MIKFQVDNSLFMVSEVDVKYRNPVSKENRFAITKSKDINELLHSVYDQDQVDLKEFFYVILLNQHHEVLGVKLISEGGIGGTLVDPRTLFQIAIKGNAAAVVVSHNHPSGNTKPSHADIELTKRLKQAGELLKITVLDHVIYTSFTYTSMADKGFM